MSKNQSSDLVLAFNNFALLGMVLAITFTARRFDDIVQTLRDLSS